MKQLSNQALKERLIDGNPILDARISWEGARGQTVVIQAHILEVIHVENSILGDWDALVVRQTIPRLSRNHGPAAFRYLPVEANPGPLFIEVP